MVAITLLLTEHLEVLIPSTQQKIYTLVIGYTASERMIQSHAYPIPCHEFSFVSHQALWIPGHLVPAKFNVLNNNYLISHEMKFGL